MYRVTGADVSTGLQLPRDHLLLPACSTVSLIGTLEVGDLPPPTTPDFTLSCFLDSRNALIIANHRIINEIPGTMIRRCSGPLLINFMRHEAVDKSHLNWLESAIPVF